MTPPGVRRSPSEGRSIPASRRAASSSPPGQVYNLLGGTAPRAPGASVEVTGYLRPDVATLCQQGVPLQVLSAQTL